jgi:hypothetical protein
MGHAIALDRVAAGRQRRSLVQGRTVTKAPRAADRAPDRAGWAVPRFTLTDEQREKIARLSGIPTTVADNLFNPWSVIEVVITTYRSRKNRRGTALLPNEVKAELQAIGDDAGKLWKRLLLLAEAKDFSFPEMAALFDLQARCSLYESEIVAAKSGRHTRDVYTLVANLDGIRQEFTGKKIKRSEKNNDTSIAYITYVCRLADPDIGRGSIKNAMKDWITRRGLIERSADPGRHEPRLKATLALVRRACSARRP